LVQKPPSNDCWRVIGVQGDRSCPELKGVVHCRNCPVFSAAGRSLLERASPEGYQEEWAEILGQEKEADAAGDLSLIVFRLGEEWLALQTRLLREVTSSRVVRRLPHRRGNVLLGLVNIQGELVICVSLANLLGLDRDQASDDPDSPGRLVVMENRAERWAFLVDEISGIHRFDSRELKPVPATVARAAARYTRGLLDREGRKIGCLDEELVLEGLARSVL